MPRYALMETIAEGRGERLWFKNMTAIGPLTTPDLAKAKMFDSEQAATASPAYSFALACFEPWQVGDA